MTPLHVLVVDDDLGVRRSLVRILSAQGFRVGTAEDGIAGLAYLGSSVPDVALVDLEMPNMGGLNMLSRAKLASMPCEIVMMTGRAGVEAAVEAVKAGAYHFLTKPFGSSEALCLVVAQAAQHKALLERTRRLEAQLEAHDQFGGIIGASPKMVAMYRLIEGVAAATSTVLILGETGTGKELVARAIHQRSPRADRPFVAVNCAAIPKELVESELFGHVRGAFTGAQSARMGLFETAHGGTLFLDEVGDLPLAAQVKLLRTLQEGEIKRVGADDVRIVDVRVLAATNVDLKARITEGSFRSDLYYRLNVIALELPPLRDRADDVLLLAHHFIHKYSSRMSRGSRPLTPLALQALRAYEWPGNVRELEHAIERAVVLAPGDVIDAPDLPPEIRPHGAPEALPRPPAESGAPGLQVLSDLPYMEARRIALAHFDEAYFGHVLRQAEGNLSEAARHAGVDRSNFKRLMRKSKGGKSNT